MKGNLSSFKNMAWAAAILLCLLALFVALIIAAATPYKGPIQRGGVQLNELQASPSLSPELQELIAPDGELKTVPETADAGQNYVDGLTFLCDSSIIGLRDYGILSGGIARTGSGREAACTDVSGRFHHRRILDAGRLSEYALQPDYRGGLR